MLYSVMSFGSQFVDLAPKGGEESARLLPLLLSLVPPLGPLAPLAPSAGEGSAAEGSAAERSAGELLARACFSGVATRLRPRLPEPRKGRRWEYHGTRNLNGCLPEPCRRPRRMDKQNNSACHSPG